ncbi:hypothetical protein LRP31_09120 [Mesorhizobium mediterraneum]|uniref:Uncharacterized protein n=1 Tax=Mesorhizobium mediterraneum TaxID=43617 RepID=A0AB36R531_9HYPH|nr:MULTISPECIES: hypothetical protein [Mesorhizobium]PAP99794.1 hypothetical protein CIT25_23300 [Mesorhizobium mediterraneum]RUU97155.1 hypothetical protein EOB36_27780 [Mesorhizobium sp. M6A.T.Cr.TU.017.01.1.1]RWN28456.1 MAG: hypothetical protein EOR96_32620 [Mesorhizobium sp.]RWP40528.1 MAG: hypothetical protein EOR05_32760 [Mesorhizobium sp.]RWP46369.1 MAG: hypothetical protein EOR06_30425 [Mesorhizobium sp.]
MGQLVIETHWERLVRRSNHQFIQAEDWLVNATSAGDACVAQDAAYEALRTGMSAAIFLYHFAEVAFERNAVNPHPASIAAMRALIQANSHSVTGDARPDDHRILGGLANAVKHAELKDPNIIEVPHTGVVVRISHGKPVAFDEGRANGTPQVVVVATGRDRPLGAIIENVSRGWNAILGLPV